MARSIMGRSVRCLMKVIPEKLIGTGIAERELVFLAEIHDEAPFGEEII
ncbi:MAG: hypothetical protein ACI8PB_001157 [Desulforhopalus sp.]